MRTILFVLTNIIYYCIDNLSFTTDHVEYLHLFLDETILKNNYCSFLSYIITSVTIELVTE